MNKWILSVACALASFSFAGPYRNRVEDTLDALDRGRRELRRAGSTCREALWENFRTVTRDVEDVSRGAPDSRLNQIQLFISGMALAGGLGDCPTPVLQSLSEAQDSISRARRIAQVRDDYDDARAERRRLAREEAARRLDREQREAERRGWREERRAPRAMDEATFGSLHAAVRSESFSDSKLAVLQTASSNGAHFTVNQLGRLVDLFTFSTDKLKVVELINPRLVDRENAFQLYSRFTFSSDKEKVQRILTAR